MTDDQSTLPPSPRDRWAEAVQRAAHTYKANVSGGPPKPRLFIRAGEDEDIPRSLRYLLEIARLKAEADELPVVAIYVAGERPTLMLVDERDLRLYFD